jgi:hypothetical protein
MQATPPDAFDASLSKKDYVTILKYYKAKIPTNLKTIRHNAEKLISTKLCRCINKLEPRIKGASVGTCTRTVINAKGLRRGAFRCTRRNKKNNTTVKLKNPHIILFTKRNKKIKNNK